MADAGEQDVDLDVIGANGAAGDFSLREFSRGSGGSEGLHLALSHGRCRGRLRHGSGAGNRNERRGGTAEDEPTTIEIASGMIQAEVSTHLAHSIVSVLGLARRATAGRADIRAI
ncbi:hypothetical protein ACO2RV_21975 [Ancylobacter sp. VNQ12]|uniref:hypothetical protein n=1 Tax=Ancylobacter sp. VNQ12 TaxID=3400920 RepID=UPI003C01E055